MSTHQAKSATQHETDSQTPAKAVVQSDSRSRLSSLTSFVRSSLKSMKSFYNLKIKEYNEVLMSINLKEQEMELLSEEMSALKSNQSVLMASLDSTFYSNFSNLLSDPSINKIALQKFYRFIGLTHKPYFVLKKIIKDEHELKYLLQHSMKSNASLYEKSSTLIQLSLFPDRKPDADEFRNKAEMEELVASCAYPLSDILKSISEFFRIMEIESEMKTVVDHVRQTNCPIKNEVFVDLKKKEFDITKLERIYADFKKWISDSEEIFKSKEGEFPKNEAVEFAIDKRKRFEEELEAWEMSFKTILSVFWNDRSKLEIKNPRKPEAINGTPGSQSKKVRLYKVQTKRTEIDEEECQLKDEELFVKKHNRRRGDDQDRFNLLREYSITNLTETNILNSMKDPESCNFNNGEPQGSSQLIEISENDLKQIVAAPVRGVPNIPNSKISKCSVPKVDASLAPVQTKNNLPKDIAINENPFRISSKNYTADEENNINSETKLEQTQQGKTLTNNNIKPHASMLYINTEYRQSQRICT